MKPRIAAMRPSGGAGVRCQAVQLGRSADVAQLVEHFTRNEGVPGSSPGVGFKDPLETAGFFVAASKLDPSAWLQNCRSWLQSRLLGFG
jgi:hypothetical protein